MNAGSATRESLWARVIQRLGGRQIAWILGMALVFRVVLNLANVGVEPSRMFKPDSHQYERYAHNLLAHGSYSLAEAAPYTPDSFRPPLYAFLLALIYGVFGQAPHLIVLLQILLGVVTTWLVYDLGCRALTPCLARSAAVLFAVAPASVLYTGFILSETLFTLLLLCSVRSLVGFLGNHDLRLAGVSGLFLGLATLTRAIAQFYVVIPLLVILLCGGRNRWRGQAVLVAGLALVLVPWMARNHVATGSKSISSAGQYNLFYFHAASVERYLHGGSLDEARAILTDRIDTRQMTDERDLASAQVGVALRTIVTQPVTFARLSVLWLGRLLFDVGNGLLYFAVPYEWSAGARESLWQLARGEMGVTWDALCDVWQTHTAWVGVVIFALCATYLAALCGAYGLAMIGAWRWLAGNGRLVGLLVVLTVVYLAVLPGPLGELRFRVPFMPFLALLTVAGAQDLLTRIRTSRASSWVSPATAGFSPN